jgi:hypothetical protein
MTIYRERLWASGWMYLSTSLVIPASLLVFLPINFEVGVITAIALYAACIAVLIGTSPVVRITNQELVAGRARVPIELIGEVTGYTGEEATLERGQRLDARAWLLIRGWVAPVVRVELADPTDPTPYWIVSTRRPNEVVAAIAKARAAV